MPGLEQYGTEPATNKSPLIESIKPTDPIAHILPGTQELLVEASIVVGTACNNRGGENGFSGGGIESGLATLAGIIQRYPKGQ